MAACVQWMKKLIRKKTFTEETLHKTDLRRCLTTLDLIGLGAGSTLGSGLYVLSGQVARETAGPATLVSFVIAGVVAGLAGLCYAEFAARIPRAGSAYVYSYVTVGEVMAFVIGWNILLEYIINVASVARALSSYLDYMVDNRMQQFFQQYMGMSVTGLAAYPDFFAFGLVLLLTGLVAIGVKESARLNNVFTVINLLIIVFIVICGFTKADVHNWQLSGEELPPSGAGGGGFAPFGFSGIMSGTATCFFAYVGFDFIASMGEEAETPRRSIPIAMGATLLINLVCYTCAAAVVSLMCPYFILDVDAPVVFAFDYVGWGMAKYVISVGAFCGMFSSVTSAIYPSARAVYAMASDGLIFTWLAYISPRFRTPLIATLLTGGLAGVLALLIDLSELIHMLSIGTLLAFALVAVCVLVLRYEPGEDLSAQSNGTVVKTPGSRRSEFKLIHLVRPCSDSPTPITACTAKVAIACMCVFLVAFSAFATLGYKELIQGTAWAMTGVATFATMALLSFVVIACQPQNRTQLNFKVPLVPLLPSLSCLANIYLMFTLSVLTWMRFGIWLIVGFSIYFFYGLRHSSLNDSVGEKEPLCLPQDGGNYNSIPHNSVTTQHDVDRDVHHIEESTQ